MARREHKTHWLLLLVGFVDGVKLRRTEGEDHLSPSQPPSEWNVRNISGLVTATLVVVFIFLSFVFSDQFRRKSLTFRVTQVSLIPEGDGKSAASSFSVVIKANSDTNPQHFVVPVDADPSKSCTFELEPDAFKSMTFSLVIRDGNMPIHFETISGAKLLETSQPAGKGRKLIIENFHEDEERLKNKQIVLFFEIYN